MKALEKKRKQLFMRSNQRDNVQFIERILHSLMQRHFRVCISEKAT